MFERCGWRVVARDDFSTVRTDQYDAELNDGLPVEMIGALRVLSETYNPNAPVQQFVWAMRPVPVAAPPTTFLEAVGQAEGSGPGCVHPPSDDVRPVTRLPGLGRPDGQRDQSPHRHSQPSHVYSGMIAAGVEAASTEDRLRSAAAGRVLQEGLRPAPLRPR